MRNNDHSEFVHQTPILTTIDAPHSDHDITRAFSFGAFAMTDNGLMKTITAAQTIKVADPFEVRDPDGRAHTKHISEAAFHGRPGRLAGEIASDGLYIEIAHRKALAESLNGVEPPSRITIVEWRGITGRESQ